MNKDDSGRPIGRILAYELSDDELDMVAGGSSCAIYTQTCTIYGNRTCAENPCCQPSPSCD